MTALSRPHPSRADQRLYIPACIRLIMGAAEAFRLFEMLNYRDSVTPETVKAYVLEALCAGRQCRLGSEAYERLDREIRVRFSGPATTAPAEARIGRGAADYLRYVLGLAAGELLEPSADFRQYDGFGPNEYREARALLGERGRRYLGILSDCDSLMPNCRRLEAFRREEREERRARQEACFQDLADLLKSDGQSGSEHLLDSFPRPYAPFPLEPQPPLASSYDAARPYAPDFQPPAHPSPPRPDRERRSF